MRIRFAILFFLLPTLAFAENLVPNGECALVVASRETMSEVRSYVRSISDQRYLQIYKSSNGWYAISIGTLKSHEVDPVMRRWRASGKIPQDSLCSSGRGYIAEISLSSGQAIRTNSTGSNDVISSIASGVGIIRSNECVELFRKFERKGENKAFAITPDGKTCGWSADYPTTNAATETAKSYCASEGRGNCRVYLEYNIALAKK